LIEGENPNAGFVSFVIEDISLDEWKDVYETKILRLSPLKQKPGFKIF
jgi:hypothetical protein